MTVNKLIHSMYTIPSKSIETDFILIDEGEIIAQGKTDIREYLDIIELKGNCNDINFKKYANENNTITIKAEDFSRFFICELMNFPTENRKNEFINKNIFIKFPRVRLCSNLSLNLSFTRDTYCSCDIQPLYEMEIRKICDIICL